MNALKEKILALIAQSGPIDVAHYMQLALADPEHGYYRTRDPLGRDFVTAPEVSQIFGELIGLFFVQAWEDRGKPKKIHLVEFGPGRGTLMADMLRAARIRPNFLDAAKISLIETSPVLREIQARTLKGVRLGWVESLEALVDGTPVFVVANEFLDALPVQQCIKSERGWHLRTVEARGAALHFGVTETIDDADTIPDGLRDALPGSVFENGAEAKAAIRHLSDHIVGSHGVGLIVDYGHMQTSLGDTFQALKAHRFVDPLDEPGEADLTFHVDFAALAETAREAGAHVSGPLMQSLFLEALGIRARGERLKNDAPEQATEIDAAIARLTQSAQMGALFKAMAISAPGSPALPGFAC